MIPLTLPPVFAELSPLDDDGSGSPEMVIDIHYAIYKARRLNFYFVAFCLFSLAMATLCLALGCCFGNISIKLARSHIMLNLDNQFSPVMLSRPAPKRSEEVARLEHEIIKYEIAQKSQASMFVAMLAYLLLALTYPLFHARKWVNRNGNFHLRTRGYIIAAPLLLLSFFGLTNGMFHLARFVLT
jgi:hypothetical protein